MSPELTSPLAPGLNEAQKRAVFHGDGPLLVFAGAGSGKTRVLTYRIAHLIMERDVEPWRILGLTFTNKAAQEMIGRVEQLVGETLARRGSPMMGTFHSICSRLLRRHGGAIGIRSDFTIFDEADQAALIKRMIRNNNIDDKAVPVQLVRALIDRAKNDGADPASMIDRDSKKAPLLQKILTAYHEELRKNNALDFGDLLTEMVRLLKESDEVRLRVQGLFNHILVDEAQDTNRVQYRLLQLLLGPHRNLCLVGDDDQSIYRWRGARVENLDDFRRDFPDAEVVVLGCNYRSTKTILDAAAAVIDRNSRRQPKKLFTDNPQGDRITLHRADDERDEAKFVADSIRRRLDQGSSPGDVAVFYRTNSQSRAIEEELVRCRMSYVIVGGTRFYDRKEVKDVLAYARIVVNPSDSVSLARVINTPTRGIGAKALESLAAIANKTGASIYDAIPDAAERSAPRLRSSLLAFRQMIETWRERAGGGDSPLIIISDIVRGSGYIELIRPELGPEAEARMDNVEELLRAVRQYEAKAENPTLPGFLETAALVSDPDTYERSAGAVSLMTLHCAKGLEFPVVFIVGLEEGLLPHSRSLDEVGGEEEERRLFYVGMTRAQRALTLTWAGTRLGAMGYSNTKASRFLMDLPMGLHTGMGGLVLDRTPGIKSWSPRAPERDLFFQGEARIDLDVQPEYETQPESKSESGQIDESQGAEVFKEGQRVFHGIFREGTVLSAEPYAGGQRVTVSFDSGESRIFLTKWARLRII